jgi:hypothetical protein
VIDPKDENPNDLDDVDDARKVKASDDLNEPDAEDKELAPTEAATKQAVIDRLADTKEAE